MESLIWNAVVLRYNEIGLKGANRNAFEKRLADNIRTLLKPSAVPVKVGRIRGRMWLHKAGNEPFSAQEWDAMQEALPRAFGLASFSPVVMIKPDWAELEPLALKMIFASLKSALDSTEGVVTFRLRVRRADKRFPFESRALECYLVERLEAAGGLDVSRLRLDLKRASVTIGIEIREEYACVWYDEYDGAGGLPVGSNDRVLTLLSGGIDSPAAAWLMMKRGCPNWFVTFDSSPYTPPEAVEKVKKLVVELDRWQGESRLWICNMVSIQKQIRDLCSPRFRTVLYRRMMMRLASRIAARKKISALVTGEAVGQVASQTIANMNTINAASSYVVIRPLAGTDKLESIAIARRIGTLEVSEQQVPDSCTVFAPDSPATRSKLSDIEYEERKLGDFELLLEEIVEASEIWSPSADHGSGVIV